MPIQVDNLTTADALTGDETLALNQGTGSSRVTKKATVTQLATKLATLISGTQADVEAIAEAVKPLLTESFSVPLCPLDSAPVAGANKGFFVFRYAFTVTAVYLEALTAQGAGNLITVDINKNGTSILGTKLTLDNTETDSVNAAAQATIVTSSFAANDRCTIDIDDEGDGTCRGLNVVIVGHQT